MSKRFLALLMALCMSILLLPSTALAADTAVHNETELQAAVATGGTVTLEADISLSSGLLVTDEYGTVVLNLCGHTLSGPNNTYAIRATNGAVLTVKNGSIRMGELTDESSWVWGVDNRGGTVTVENVVFSGTDNMGMDFATANWDWSYVICDEEGNPTYGAGGQVNTREGFRFGTTTLSGCTVNGDYNNGFVIAYNDPGNKLTVQSGSYVCSVAADGGSVVLQDGDFTRVVDYSEGKDSVTVNGGRIHSIDSGLPVIPAAVQDTVFQSVDRVEGTVPAGFGGKIVLNNAYIASSAKLLGGSYSGTVRSFSKTVSFGTAATLTAELVASMNSCLPAGSVVQWNEAQGKYEVGTCPTATIQLVKSEDKCSVLSVNKGTSYYAYNRASLTVNAGEQVTLYMGGVTDPDYRFSGWFDGETLVSADAVHTLTATSSATYTARFEEKPSVAAEKAAAAEWLGDYAAQSEYVISTKEEMHHFAVAVNRLGKDFSGKTVKLAASLDYTGETYTPVGSQTQSFKGTFDGQDKTISGIRLTSGSYLGVFGHSRGTIRSLHVKDCVLTGTEYVGGIAGEAGGKIIGCSAENVEVSGWFAGCIAGHTYGMTVEDVTVTGCTANGGGKAGAVFGYADDLKLTGATVSGFSGNGGALIGHCNAGSTVLTNLVVDAAGKNLINTTYSSSVTDITIQSSETGETSITCAALLSDMGWGATDTTSLKIISGTYAVGSILAAGNQDSQVDITAGNYSVDVSDYVNNKTVLQVPSIPQTPYAVGATAETLLQEEETTGTVTVLAVEKVDGTPKTLTVNAEVVLDNQSGEKLTVQRLDGQGPETLPYYVAGIGETRYETLDGALSDAAANETVFLLQDVELSGNVTVPADVTLALNGKTLAAGGSLITLQAGARVVTAKGDASLNAALNAASYLVAYSENESSRVYAVSDVLLSSPEVFMAGHATTITAQNGTDSDTNLFLSYTADGTEYVALYNSSNAARIFGGWKYPAAGVSTTGTATSLTIRSGKVDSLRGSSKAVDGSSIASATIHVEGGTVGIVASGWYYNQSVQTFHVRVSGGTVGTIYGNGETSYTASASMPAGFVPTVDTANIEISGGTVGFVYGGGRALTQKNTSADYSMLTRKANISITGGSVSCVNGGGFNGPEANWSESAGQDRVTVEQALITVSGGQVTNLFAGGYNGQWKFTHKIAADGSLVFSNYNGQKAEAVRNMVDSAEVHVEDGADIENLYMGARGYAQVGRSAAYISGGTIGSMSTGGNYGYVENSSTRISGGAITKLELVTRNYVGDITLDVTGGAVTDFYAGMGGAYKNANCVEQPYNLSTVAILGDVDIRFAAGTVSNAYLTSGLEQADSVQCNLPLTVRTMPLAGSDYTGSKTTSGNFASEKEDAVWNATIILNTENESFNPSGAQGNNLVYASGDAGKVVLEDEYGVRRLGPAPTPAANIAQIGTAYYTSLAAAYAAARDGDSIRLLAACSESLTVEKEITIQYGDYLSQEGAITPGSGYAIKAQAAGSVTFARLFTITFDANGGSVTPESAKTNAEGKLTSLPTPTHSGCYSFKGWYDAASGGTKVTIDTVFNADTTIYAQWTYTGGSGVSTYAITVDSAKNGDVTSSHKSASKGTTVTITVEPDEGYTLETLTVTDKNGDEIRVKEKNGKYTFTMPASKVYVEATFMEDNSMLNFFMDVPADAYYYDAVLWAAKNGITGGVDDTHFAPNATCTRAQAVTFLWRAAGSPAPKSSEMPFEDVAAGSYYYDAVLWAVENGITKGTSDTTFTPDAECTRGQIVTFLWRSQASPAAGTVNPFADVKADAYYAEAVLWAVKEDITNGTSSTTFSPDADCTRAQIVTFLWRALTE